MEAALHQNAGAAEGNGLVNTITNFVYRMHVCVRLTGPAVKRTEGADDVADVRVVDISVNDIRNYIARILALTDLVRGKADADKIA